MKTQRALLFMVLCAAVYVRSFSQSTIGRQNVDQYPVTAWGTPTYGLTWLPTDYNLTTTKYPLIIFLHGSGEGGDGVSGLWNLLTYGLPREIANGWNAEAVNPSDGQNYKFIVVSPQAPSAAHWSYAWGSIQWVLQNVISRYRIDTTRIYVTGLSAGGAGSWSCVTNGPDPAKKFPAIVPVSSAGTNISAELDQIPLVGGTYGVKVWSITGANDGWLAFATSATNSINNATPAPAVPALLTAVPGAGHDPGVWNVVYSPNWRSNAINLNMYEWMLKYQRNTSVPLANAGPNQTITLPANSVTLNGTGTAGSGNTIVSYGWTWVSGPASYSILSPSSASTQISGLTQGTYVFRLTVTDNLNATATSDVVITVNPIPNLLPVANAGADQTIMLPVNSVGLNGSATDADGSIASYQWTRISGPASYNLLNAGSAQATASNLVQGVYQFELRVTDNGGALGNDTVSITVNPAPNIRPVALAGTDQTITLPLNTVIVNGSATDADGTINSYQWTKVSGPSCTIASASSAQTTINNLIQGVYQFELKVTDNAGGTAKDTVSVSVNPAPNVAPTANAGADQNITLPVSSVSLSGSGTDVDGTIASYQWTKISGPASSAIVSPTQALTTVTSLVQGIYQFELKVTDNQGAIGKDTISITVNPAANKAPVVSAGLDQTLTLPVNSTTLNGSGTDLDGMIASYQWSKISGPAAFSITGPSAAQTTISGLAQGSYQFELMVTDNQGAMGKDTVSVTVNAANIPPLAHAGSDQIIALPVDSTILNGSGTDSDGSISSYRWKKISGPVCSMSDSTQAQMTLHHLLQGSYGFELSVTDNKGTAGSDTVYIDVHPAPNQLPVVHAGTDISITLPADSASLFGSASDSDGSIASYQWTKISGPAQYHLVDSSQPQTAVKNLMQGIYGFELAATDNKGVKAKDTVFVTVNSAVNIPPLAHAGTDTTITLPVDSLLFSGSGEDVDGTITAYSWTRISGPSSYIFTDSTKAQTIVEHLSEGVYKFELRVTDNQGAIARDTISILVNTQAPVVCKGVKKYIIPGGDGGSYYSAVDTTSIWYTPIHPGDTLVLKAQYSWSYFSLENYSGTAVCPIVITNEGGQVWMTAGIETKSCRYMKITGSGDSNTYYGFRIYNPGNDGGGVAVSIQGKSRVIEVERVDVYKKTYGVWAKQDPLCDLSFNYPNYVMDSIEVHHCRFKNIGQDCIYAGNTDPLAQRDTWCNGVVEHYIPMRLSNINLHHLVIDSCNRTGIQLSGADQGYNQIHDNVITRCGYEYNQQHGTGISIGGMTKNCHVYNNSISNTFIYGILDFGAGVNYIENNIVDSSGWLDGVPNTISRPVNILASTKETIPFDSSTVIIRFNKLGVNATTDSTNLAVVVWGPPTWTVNNVICSNTKMDGTPALISVDKTVQFINDCSIGLPNMPPTAYAGNNIQINPPVNSVVLHGSGSDPDGMIVSYHWARINGPSQYSVADPDSATTSITNLVQGVYTFRLTVMDDDSLKAIDDIQISVAPPNTAPIANAGSNQILTLPVSTTTMNGSGVDPDGTITSYLWTKISGPASFSMVNAASPQTQVNNLVQGIYQFELKVTDDGGAEDRDTVTITVNPAPPPTNLAPVAHAGADQTITLPNDIVTLNGSGTDADGTVASYQWTKISGPTPYIFSNASQPQTTVSNIIQGTYLFLLTVTDNLGAKGRDTVMVTVNPQPNVAPVANAGADQAITLPVNSVVLSGGGTDVDGSVVSYQWTKVSGPGSFSIVSPAKAKTTVNNLVQGMYLFELRVADNNGALGRDTVKITVNAAIPHANVPPVAHAGADQTITLPANSVTLNGSGTDADGTVSRYQWSMISGAASYVISSPNQSQTQIQGLTQGQYKFELTVTDDNGATGKDTVIITVNAAVPPANLVPVANAGNDQLITLPQNKITLVGSGTDADGSITGFGWTKISGPAPGILAAPTAAQTDVTNLVQGVYQFELKVTDNQGASGKDTVTITVLPASAPVNIPPVAHAGADQTITLPTNVVTLNGIGTDADGTITAYSWTKISGPSQGTIISPPQALTAVSNLVPGVYKFELKVTDNMGATGRDTVMVTVNEQPPSASTATIYPNPVSNILNVRIDAITHRNLTDIRIYDAKGSKVYEEEFLRTQQVVVKQVDVSELCPGVYVIVVGVDINTNITLKFVKE